MTIRIAIAKRHAERGMTLLELTFAVAILALMLGAAAQSLISFQVAMDVQQQQVVAVQNCLGVISAMRTARDTNPTNFPGAITTAWPNGGQVANAGTLTQEAVRVTYANATANPLQVTVTSTWRDLRNRPMQRSVTTLLTDR